MEEVLQLLQKQYPGMAKLLRPTNTESNSVSVAKSLELPDDYYEFYSFFDGEEDDSDGVFGLHKCLPQSVSLDLVIRDKEELKDIPRKYQYDLFVPIFKTPGRQLIGYAKHGDKWDFAEYDIWLGKHQDESLTVFIDKFVEKVKNDGYAIEEGINGLIDKDEM